MSSRKLLAAASVICGLAVSQAFAQTPPTVGGATNAAGGAVNAAANNAAGAIPPVPNAEGQIQNRTQAGASVLPAPAGNTNVQGAVQGNVQGAMLPNRSVAAQSNLQAQPSLQTAPGDQVSVGVTASAFNDNRPEQWRYRQDNGHWWYWTPDNRWMWYNGTQWTYYDQPSAGATTTYQSAPYTTNYGSYDYAPSYGYGYGYGYPYYGGYYRGYPGYYGGYYGGYGYRNGVSIGVGGVGIGIGGGGRRR